MPLLRSFGGELPNIETALVLAPHPEDEALGCGGTIVQLNAMGASSSVIFLTDGERLYGDADRCLAEKRKNEGLISSKILGCGTPEFLGFPDGGLIHCMQDVCERLSSIAATKKPDIVFAPSPIDHHRDHIATARIAMKLLGDIGSFRLAFYEVYSTLRFTHLIEITDVIEKKKKAILNYETSLYGKPRLYADAALGLNAHRALFLQKQGYYEAFHIVEGAVSLTALLDRFSYKDIQP